MYNCALLAPVYFGQCPCVCTIIHVLHCFAVDDLMLAMLLCELWLLLCQIAKFNFFAYMFICLVQHLWIKNIILYLKRADGEPVVRPVKT
jgi:hypothetical protein